jgi:hypothetical protein
MTAVEIACTSACGLLDELRPATAKHLRNGPYIFRGHGDASWSLVSRAWRDDCLTSYECVAIETLSRDRWDAMRDDEKRRACEIVALALFLEGADTQGLMIPGDRGELRLHNNFAKQLELAAAGVDWPPESLCTMLGIAQHYGVPTRLLDWTRRGLVAAYFAATHCVVLGDRRTPDAGERLAVWALQTCHLEHHEKVRFIRCPMGSSPNLALQQGVFTAARARSRTGELASRSLDEVAHGDTPEQTCDTFKLTLPTSEAPALLHYLATENVHGGTVWAGHHGAAAHALEYGRRIKP